MSEQHTPEPWPVFTDIATTMTPDPEGTPVAILSWDDYIRARACVNACAGFSIEELEGASLFNDSISAQDEIDSLKSEVEEMKLIIATDTGTESAVAAMQKQRDELLAALRPLITSRMGAEQIREGIQKAIASVKANTQ